jgi:hypothetical protein
LWKKSYWITSVVVSFASKIQQRHDGLAGNSWITYRVFRNLDKYMLMDGWGFLTLGLTDISLSTLKKVRTSDTDFSSAQAHNMVSNSMILVGLENVVLLLLRTVSSVTFTWNVMEALATVSSKYPHTRSSYWSRRLTSSSNYNMLYSIEVVHVVSSLK